MKFKILSLILILSIFLIIPTVVLGFEDVESYKENAITYKLFNNGTAEIIAIENDSLNDVISIYTEILYNEESYKIESIAKDAFDLISTKQSLRMNSSNAPIIDKECPFNNIENIFIGVDAKGYTKDAGWPVEKIKQYVIETQPQDIVVTPKEISDGVVIDTSASIAAGAGSIGYDWYLCDADGKILNDSSVSGYASFKIPFDLSYDNENNLPKDYYYVCVIGEEDEFPEKTRVAKVTVNPGPYKVSFDCGELAEWSIESKDGLIETYTNNDRKLDQNDIPSSDFLVHNGKGVFFAGWWNVDLEKIVDPSTTTFEKNTYLSAMWKVKINFDANGGVYDESTVFSTNLLTDVSNYAFEDEVMEPKREGYKFLGFFTEKEDGQPYEFVMDSLSFNEETTFYAQWEELENIIDDETSEKNQGGVGTGESIENPDDEINQEDSDKEEISDDKVNEEGSDKEEISDDKVDEEVSDKEESDEDKVNEEETIKEEPNDEKTNQDDSEEIADDKVNEEASDKEEVVDNNKENSNDNISKDSNSEDSTNNSPVNTIKKDEINTPQTGDEIFLYTILLVISLGGILITTVLKRNTY